MTRFLITAFDGLQPSQVQPDLAPNLSEFAAGGVTFTRNHPVFPTGDPDQRRQSRYRVSPRVARACGELAGLPRLRSEQGPTGHGAVLTKVADLTGRVLLVPTLADILHEHGREYVAVGVGTSGNAYVQNPQAETAGGASIHPEFCLPRGLHGEW